jgi:hypothetical protein
MSTSIVLDVDDRGRVSVGKLLSGVDRVIATEVAPGQILLEAAVVVRAIVPAVKADVSLANQIDASLADDQTFVPRRRRSTAAKTSR